MPRDVCAERFNSTTSGKKAVSHPPIMGIPNSAIWFIVTIDTRRSSHVAALSPVQCAVYLPDPTKVDLESTKGLSCVMAATALCVAMLSMKPYKLCAL